MGMHVLNVKKEGWSITAKNKISKDFVLLFSQELLALLKAGLSIVEALEALQEKETHAATNLILSRILQDLRDGIGSRALLGQPEIFSSLYAG
jgi:general secretion pathway protein F